MTLPFLIDALIEALEDAPPGLQILFLAVLSWTAGAAVVSIVFEALP